MSAIPEERDPERRIETLSRRMKADWDGRALKNARYYIATSCDDSESAFRASGLSDVEHFFTGLEHLLSPEKVLLDIGCGIGRMDEHIAPRVGRIIGLDVSAEMVRRARERLAHVGNIEFLEGNGRDLGVVPDDSVDLAFSHIVFQHMSKAVVAGYLSDARRVLVPGGLLAFQVPESIKGVPEEPDDNDTFELRFYEEEDLAMHLERLGYAEVSFARHRVDGSDTSFNHLRTTCIWPG